MKKLIVALVLSLALIGCSGGGGGPTSTPMPDKAVSTPTDTAATPAMEKTPTAEETPAEDG